MQYLSLKNIFWYFLAYGLTTFAVMKFMPKEKRQKILTFTIQGSFLDKASALISLVSRNIIMVFSLFIPFYANIYLIITGNVVYIIGLVLATVAMWQFSRVKTDEAITWGLYKISRNPMQVMGFIMGIGVGIIANNLWLWILTVINIISSYPMFFMQEKYCIEKYGQIYTEYMKKTPRILFIKGKK
ncbi:MAG: isoprenylcysteine carboxylmethyltransferase family protein [Spirochaetaceae bacterium]|nr:isoprenylcysteine carboxylmethyltransferase family protein [Spirochaetaceae bacterium]